MQEEHTTKRKCSHITTVWLALPSVDRETEVANLQYRSASLPQMQQHVRKLDVPVTDARLMAVIKAKNELLEKVSCISLGDARPVHKSLQGQ